MNLRYLPGYGSAPWPSDLGYLICSTSRVPDAVVVLGRKTLDGRPRDWFVAVYTESGERLPGSGIRLTPDGERAKEIFDDFILERRRAA